MSGKGKLCMRGGHSTNLLAMSAIQYDKLRVGLELVK